MPKVVSDIQGVVGEEGFPRDTAGRRPFARTLWALARPKGMPLVALLTLIGFSFAYWDHGCSEPKLRIVLSLLFLAGLWIVGHAGTMWLNAALDRDEGPVLFGTPVPVPPGLERYGYAALALSVAAAFAAQLALGVCVLGCAVLAILYSHPRIAWKGRPVLGPLSNALGYGILAPLGGFVFAELPPSPRGAAVLCISVCFILAAYLAAQAFQEDEDRARGYRTLVATRGPRFTLSVARWLLLLAVLLTLGLAVVGWFPRGVLASAPAFVVVDRFLVRWRDHARSGGSAWAASFFKRMTVAGLLCLAAGAAHSAWPERAGGAREIPADPPSAPVC